VDPGRRLVRLAERGRLAGTRLIRLEPLHEREFRLLFAGQLVSLIGSAMAPIALAFAVLGFGSASDLGLVLAAGWVPQIVFILAGGVWADRLPRNRVMVAANALSGLAQLGVAVLVLTGNASLWPLVALQVVRGVAIAFFFPASQGVVPQVVSPEHLQPANALLRLSQNSTNILGAAVGGVLVATSGSGWALACDAATYFASAILLSRIRIVLAPRESALSFIHELAEGWHEFRSRTWLWLIVVMAGIGNMVWVASSSVLGPLVAKRELGGAAAWGLVVAMTATGNVAGGLVSLRWRPKRLLFHGTLGLAGLPLLLGALAVPAPLTVVAAFAAVAGFGVELFGVYWVTALQQHISAEVLARVSSYDALGSFVLIPVGLTIVGPAADAFGVSTTLWIAAAVSAATALLALGSRDVRTLARLD
jgi:MFS family permease